MWYLWKARNDKKIANKNCTAWQLHHAVAAYITTINSHTGVPDEQPQQASCRSNREQTDGDTATMATTPLLQHHSSLNNSRQGITSTFCWQRCNTHNHTAGAHEPAANAHYNPGHTVRYELFHCRKWTTTITGVLTHHKPYTKIQHCWKDLDATQMPPLCQIMFRLLQRRLELESSLSVLRSSRRKMYTSKQPCPAQSQS